MAERQSPRQISERSALKAIGELTAIIDDAADLINKVSDRFTVDDNELLQKRTALLRKFVDQGGSIAGDAVRDFGDAIHDLDKVLSVLARPSIPPEIDLISLGLSSHNLADAIHNNTETVSGDLDQLHNDLRSLVTNISQIQYEEFKNDLNKLTNNLADATRGQIDRLLDLEESLRETLKLSCTENTSLRELKALFDSNLQDPSMQLHPHKRHLDILSNRLGDLLNVVRNRDIDIDDIKQQTIELAVDILHLQKDSGATTPADLERDPEKYLPKVRNVTYLINYLRGWMADNPAGTGVGKNNRLSGAVLANLQDELNDLNWGIASIIHKEELVGGNKDLRKKTERVRFEYDPKLDTLGRESVRIDFINQLKDLNTALHQLSTLIVTQYPDVVKQPGGTFKLGHTAILNELKQDYSDNFLRGFEASRWLRVLHNFGYLHASECTDTKNELRFKFSENVHTPGREVVGSATSKSYWVKRAYAAAIFLPSVAAGLYFSGGPEIVQLLSAPVLALQLYPAWQIRASHNAAIQSRFDVTVTRDAEGNALRPEDIVSRCLCVAKSMSRIAHQVGSLNPAADMQKDETTQKLIDPFRALVGQTIKALTLAVEKFDQLASNDTTQAANARIPIEKALADVVAHKEATMKAWNRSLFWPIFSMGGTGILGATYSLGTIYHLASLLW